MAKELNERAAERRKRRMPKQQKSNAPVIIRTQPRDFDRRHLLLRICTVVAIVLSASIGLSIFFRVDTVTVVGGERYSAWTVSEASGIDKGDSLLFFGRATAGSRIMAKLPYIKSVRFSIKLPGTVNIIVEEAPVAYGLQDADGNWWLMTSDSVIMEQVEEATARTATVITGVTLRTPKIGEKAVAYEDPESTAATTGADRLAVALQLIGDLEQNELLGDMTVISVDNLQALQMCYADRFEVLLGDRQQLDVKIATVKGALRELGDYQEGTMTLMKNGEEWNVGITFRD